MNCGLRGQTGKGCGLDWRIVRRCCSDARVITGCWTNRSGIFEFEGRVWMDGWLIMYGHTYRPPTGRPAVGVGETLRFSHDGLCLSCRVWIYGSAETGQLKWRQDRWDTDERGNINHGCGLDVARSLCRWLGGMEIDTFRVSAHAAAGWQWS